MRTTYIEYSKEDLNKIEKENKTKIMELFRELNEQYLELKGQWETLNSRYFDIQTAEYNRGYSDGMKRMLETIEKVFSKSKEHET